MVGAGHGFHQKARLRFRVLTSEHSTVIVFRRGPMYTVVKIDGATPKKGGLVRGYDKQMHGSCAIYFSGGMNLFFHIPDDMFSFKTQETANFIPERGSLSMLSKGFFEQTPL